MESSSTQLEASIIGSLLINPSSYYEVQNLLKPKYFSNAAYSTCYQAMIDLDKEGLTIDTTTVAARTKLPASVFKRLLTTDLVYTNIKSYVQLFLEDYQSRKTSLLLSELKRMDSEGGDTAEVLELAQSHFQNLSMMNRKDTGSLLLAQKEYLRMEKDKTTFTNKLGNLTAACGGMRRGEIWTIGGITGGGKSYFVLDFMMNQIIAGHNVLLFSSELARGANLKRLVNMYRYYKNIWNFTDAMRELISLDNFRIYSEITTASGIASEVLHQKKTKGVDLVIVDYLQALTTEGDKTSYDKITDDALALRDLARRESVGVFVVSQLNRGSTGAKFSYSGSGAIEQVAFMALLLDKDEDDHNLLSILKNRGGGFTGTFPIEFRFDRFKAGTFVDTADNVGMVEEGGFTDEQPADEQLAITDA